MRESTGEFGTLLYLDVKAIENLNIEPSVEGWDIDISETEGGKGQLQIGLKNILGLTHEEDLQRVSRIQQKMRRSRMWQGGCGGLELGTARSPCLRAHGIFTVASQPRVAWTVTIRSIDGSFCLHRGP